LSGDMIEMPGTRINRLPIQSVSIVVHGGAPYSGNRYPVRADFSMMCQVKG
jgi:hypothetical protein